MYYYWCIEHIAHHITLPTPTITGSLNSEATDNRVIWRPGADVPELKPPVWAED